MVKVLFDHQTFSLQRYGGISRYFSNIVKELNGRTDFECKVGVVHSRNHYLETREKILTGKLWNSLLKSDYGKRDYKVNGYYCEYLLKKGDFDIFHPTYYDPYYAIKVRKPVVLTVHDMTHERLPEYFWAMNPLTHQKRLSIERADKIIAISQATKNDILRYSNADPKKIEVIYHGIDICSPLKLKTVAGIPDNYLLFVGDRSGYKNFYIFIKAFKELSVKYPELEVILTGGGPLGIADLELFYRLGLQSRIRHLQVTDDELNFLYQKASVFVYPSLNEGFGLPILEAGKAGCPMVLSDIDCFREIAQDSALFFDPFDVQALINAIESILTDSSLRLDLIAKSAKRLECFPIEKSVKETLDLYRTLGAER